MTFQSKPTILPSDLKKLRPAFTREFKNDEINSVDFSDSGMFALCGLRTSIKCFRLDQIVSERTFYETDGIGIAKYFNRSRVIYSTAKNQIKLIDTHSSSSPTTTFPGHRLKISSLSLLGGNKFMTASLDNKVKIWDIRKPSTVFTEYTKKSHPIVACNPINRQIAIAQKGNECQMIEIIDFMTTKILKRFKIDTSEDVEVTALDYSNDGTLIMLNTRNSLIILIDSDNGEILHQLRGINNLYNDKIDACFTPCSKFVLSGSQNGQIHCWRLCDSEKEFIFENEDEKNQPFLKIAFNKNAMCLACAGGSKFYIWIEE